MVQQEKERREQAKESIVALERSDANTNQFGIEANQKMMLAKEKRDLADKKRQEAIQLATEYDNLVHIETQRLNVKHKIKPSELKLNGEKSNGGIDDEAKNLYRNRP